MHPTHRTARWRVAGLAFVAAVALTSLGVSGAPARADEPAKVTVMTRNLYLGGDLTPSMLAPTVQDFLAANAALLAHVDLVDFTARADLFAREILDNKPDLVGLQEVALWRTGAFNDPAQATTVRYDYLALLTAALGRSGHPYDIAVVQQEADLEAPASGPYFLDIRLTMRDVILIRRGGRLQITGHSSGNFAQNFGVTLPSTGTYVPFIRGWTAVDVTHGDRPLRFVNTHLEAFHPYYRMLQAQELLSGPLATAPGDVLLGGDLNSGPDQPNAVNRLAYEALIAGGMRDSWPTLYPDEPGYTSSLGNDLDQPADKIFERIDIIMFRGSVMAASARTFGVEWQTQDGRWASDHLGYAAVFALL